MTPHCVTRPPRGRAPFRRGLRSPRRAWRANGLGATRASRPGLLALVVVTLSAVAPLRATSAADLYTAALIHEREVRAPAEEPASLAQLRDAIAAYEDIVRQYPRSGYSDNALWQAAGLALEAFDRYQHPTDRARGVRFLEMIASEYPSSSLVSRLEDRLAQFDLDTGAVQVRAIRRERLADVVRVTIELDEEVHHISERLDGPPRLYFDFRGTAAAPLQNAGLTFFDDGDIVRKIRVGHHPEQTTRIVLDIEDVETYSVYPLYDPYRLVVDVAPIPAMGASRTLSPPPLPVVATSDSSETEPPAVRAGGSLQLLEPAPVEARRLDPYPHTGIAEEDGVVSDLEPADLGGPRLHELLYPDLGSQPQPFQGAN